MQTQGGRAAEQAITSRERSFSPRLWVDWNRNGGYDHPLSDMSRYASTVRTDRALTGSTPEEITLISGHAAAELSATVAGTYDGQSLVQVFSPYNGRSPFYLAGLVGVAVEYSLELHTPYGTVSYPQFTGFLRTYTPNRSAGTVKLSALDRVEVLRAPVDLPTWALSRYWANRGRTRAQLCDSQWVIDYCLRECGVSPTGQAPTPRSRFADSQFEDQARFFLAGTGSVAPSAGRFDNWAAQTFPHTEAGAGEMYAINGVQPDALRAAGEQRPLCFATKVADYASKYWVSFPAKGATYAKEMYPSNSAYISVQLATHTDTHQRTNGAPLINVRFRRAELELYVTEGTVWARFFNEVTGSDNRSTRYAIPSGRDSVHVQLGWEFSDQNGLRIYVAFDEATEPWEQLSAETPPEFITYDPLEGLVVVNRVVDFNDLAFQKQDLYNADQDASSIIEPAQYWAVLDPSNNRLTSLPDRQGVDAWDVISEVAAAEFGSVFWDESGVFRFWTYDTVMSKQSEIVRTLTLDDMASLTATATLDSVRNVWSVTMNRNTGIYGTVFEATDPDAAYIPGNTRAIVRFWETGITVPNPYPMAQYDTHEADTTHPTWHDDITHGYVAQWLMDDPNTPDPAPVWREADRTNNEPMTSFIDENGYLCVNFFNDFAEPMRFARNSENGDGKAALRIEGSYLASLDDYTTEVRTPDSIAQYGRRNINLSGDWYQDEFQTSRLLDLITQRTADPVPNTENITIPGDPRLQLADTLAIRDPAGFGAQLHAQIFGISRTLDINQGLTDRLTVELIRPPGRGVWDSTAYGLWDYSLVWS